MKKRLPPKTGRQVEENKPQASVPNDGKSRVTGKEAQGPNNEPAARSFVVEDEDWIQQESKRSRLKWVLGIEDDDFCEGLVYQLSELMRYDDENFDFVLSFLKGTEPVDKQHSTLFVLMAICLLAGMKQSQVLVRPVRFELPVDFRLAIHHAKYDTSRLDKQKIRIDDQQVRQAGERSVTRLMQTYVMLLQASAAYRKASEEPRHKAQKNSPTRLSQGLNGSQQSGAQVNGSPIQQKSSINIQKSNGPASS